MKIVRIDFNHPLVKNARLPAIMRFIRWQIKSRLFRRVYIKAWIGNSKYYVRSGEKGLTQNIYAGLSEFSEMGFLLHFLQRGDEFIDVGANSGSYTILSGAVAGARTLAIEPIKDSYDRLVANIELNGLVSISQAKNVGLGASRGFIEMTFQEDSTNHVAVQGESITEVVQMMMLDDFIEEWNPILLKIDVEGWEREVLRGGAAMLAKDNVKAVIIELNESGRRYGVQDSEIVDLLHLWGFEGYEYDPMTRSINRVGGKNLRRDNSIFLRDIDFVRQRLLSAPIHKLLNTWI